MTSETAGARTRGQWRTLALLVAGALLVRGSLFALRGDYLDWDEALYLLMARNFLTGAGISLNGFPHIALSPLFPIATAAVSTLSGLSLLTAGRLVSALAGAVLLIPVWYLFRIHAGERIATLGATLLVGWTALIDVGPRFGPMWRHMYAGSEPLYLALLFGALALGELGMRREGRRRYLYLALAGSSLALAYLARPEAILVGGLYAIFRSLPVWGGERAGAKLAALAICAASFLTVASPYVVHMREVTGRWTLSGKLQQSRATTDMYEELVRDDSKMGPFLRVWWAVDESHTRLINPYWGTDGSVPLEQQNEEYRALLNAVRTTVTSPGQRVIIRARDYASALWVLGVPLFLPLVVVGLFWPGWKLPDRLPPFTLAGLAASVLTAWLVFVLPRYFLYLVPAFAFWAAIGVTVLARFRWPAWVREPERAIAFALLATALGIASARALSGEANAVRAVGKKDREAAERLAQIIPESHPVVSWHPRLAYWGGWDWRALPVAPLDAAVHYSAHRRLGTLFLARGGYSPLELEADYVVITLDPALAAAYRAFGSGEAEHPHPPATLLSVDEVAGFPAGRIIPGDSAGGGGPE